MTYLEIRYYDFMSFQLNAYVAVNRPVTEEQIKRNQNPLPDALRLVVDDEELVYLGYAKLNIFQYIYRKYFKKHFFFAQKFDWEKEAREL